MPAQDQRAVEPLEVPDANRAVVAGAGDARAVRAEDRGVQVRVDRVEDARCADIPDAELALVVCDHEAPAVGAEGGAPDLC